MQNKISSFFDKFIVPLISIILIGICTWIFFTRIDKIEVLASKLNDSVMKMEVLVSEMDKALSSNAITHAAIIEDVNAIKQDVASLKATVDYIKTH